MKKFWQARLLAAIVATALSIWGAFDGGGWWHAEVVALVLIGLITFPFMRSDNRAEAERKARLDARRAADHQR